MIVSLLDYESESRRKLWDFACFRKCGLLLWLACSLRKHMWKRIWGDWLVFPLRKPSEWKIHRFSFVIVSVQMVPLYSGWLSSFRLRFGWRLIDPVVLDPVRQDNDKIWILGKSVPSLSQTVYFNREISYLFAYCFSCCCYAQLGLRQLGLPGPNYSLGCGTGREVLCSVRTEPLRCLMCTC